MNYELELIYFSLFSVLCQNSDDHTKNPCLHLKAPAAYFNYRIHNLESSGAVEMRFDTQSS